MAIDGSRVLQEGTVDLPFETCAACASNQFEAHVVLLNGRLPEPPPWSCSLSCHVLSLKCPFVLF